MMDLLRFATAGSVDDGKSTLIGRLLYDTKSIFSDQLEAVERTSHAMGADYVNLALLTDGLRAEREQGITIDVAYRYFATPRRRFIVADTPGHQQYTRNMVTGASTADLALVLVDARKGVVEQSRRHAVISSLLRIPHVVVCINKMDLVDYDRSAFDRVVEEFSAFAARLDVPDVRFVPISALHGDNVVTGSPDMAWYDGPTLLHHLETVHVASDRNLIDARFPVQYVIRPQDQTGPYHDYRGYAGTMAGGVLKPGDEIVVLPSGRTTTVASIDVLGGSLEQASAGQSVAIRLADDLDVGRGDMLCRPGNRPQVGSDLEAMVCWLSESTALRPGTVLALKHTTRWVRAKVAEVRYRMDVTTLHRDESVDELQMNDIGRVTLRTTSPLLYDEYRNNRTTGSFVLVDESTNATVGAGMLLAPS